MNTSFNKRPAVIAALHAEISRTNPCLPGVRGRNKIAEATSAALADAGLLTLPKRLPGQKQPKASNLEELSRVTERHLRQIIRKWECIENVRAVLLQKQASQGEDTESAKLDRQDIAALCAAIIAALNQGAVPAEDIRLVRQLVAAAKGFLQGSAKKKQDPRTRGASNNGRRRGSSGSSRRKKHPIPGSRKVLHQVTKSAGKLFHRVAAH